MSTSTFSIIVPVYNAEKYLSECIDSILSQSFTDFELLLIDDGSKDKSGIICDEYAERDNRVHVFHRENAGASAARNLGLDKAKGQWITFVDSDDWIVPDYLECMLDKAVKFNVDAVFCNCYYVFNNETIPYFIYKQDEVHDGNEILKKFLIKFGIRSELWGKIIRRKFLENLRIKENITIGEDLLYLMELYTNYNIKTLIIKDPLYYYRQLPSSVMNSSNLLASNIKILSEYLSMSEHYSQIKDKNPEEHSTFIVRMSIKIIREDILKKSEDIQLMALLKNNFQKAKKNLQRNEKRFYNLLAINPTLCFLSLKTENFIIKNIINKNK